jgi:ABC-type amino acid transport substrate-binding protein
MAKHLIVCFLLLSSIFVSPNLNAAPPIEQIVLWQRNYERPAFLEAIKLALSLTENEYGETQIVPSAEIEQGRAIASLSDDTILDVLVAGIDEQREKLGLPIYVPIDRGLLGFRICLTASQSLAFNDIKDLDDFRKHGGIIGVGTHWPDKKIFTDSGLQMAHTPNFAHLFAMLSAGRFECLLRSVTEIDDEVAHFSEFELYKESELAFVYPLASFIFVNKNNPELHERLTKGLDLAIANGQFFELFEEYYADKLAQQQFYERKFLFLQNTNLSNEALHAINRYGVASFSIPLN